jgi:hypothetical protein
VSSPQAAVEECLVFRRYQRQDILFDMLPGIRRVAALVES